MSSYNVFDDPLYQSRLESSLPVTKKPVKESGWESAKRGLLDVGASFGSGSGQLVRGVGTFLAGSDSAIAEAGDRAVEFYDELKSSKLKSQEAELSAKMQDDKVGMGEVAGYVASNPYLALNMVSSSVPAMAVGMGAGGLVARGMVSAGVMTSSAGGLTALGARVAGGVGEGLAMAPDVYEATQGNAEASAAALALGVVTNMVTPGNVSGAAMSRITKSGAGAVEDALNKTAVRRVAGSMVGEGAQEFGQEFGQSLIEQDGRGEKLNIGSALKSGAVGAVLGAHTALALHPVTGEGAPKTRSDGTLTEAGLSGLTGQLADVNAALEAQPNNPVLMATASAVEARIAAGTATTPEAREAAQAQLVATELRLQSERNPGNRDLDDQADHATAAAALMTAGEDGVKAAADMARGATVDAINQATDHDSALAAYASGESATSVLRTVTAGLSATAKAAALQTAPEVAHTFDEATAEIVTPEQALKLERERLKTQQQAIKTQTAQAKLDAEIAKAKGVMAAEPTSREELFAQYEPEIRLFENKVLDASLPDDARVAAKNEMYRLQAERDTVAANLFPQNEQLEQIEYAQPVESAPATKVQLAAKDMLADGYREEVAREQETLHENTLIGTSNSINVRPSLRRHAFEVLQDRGINTGLNRAQFEAREAALERALADVVRDNPGTDPGLILSNANAFEIKRLASLTRMGGSVAMVGRVAMAFRTGRHMGNVDDHVTLRNVADNEASVGPYTIRAAPDRRTADVVDAGGGTFETYHGSWAVQDAEAVAQRLNRRSGANSQGTSSITDELRQAAAEVEAEPATPSNVREVTQNFEARATRALRDGTLEKLGKFWTTVMSGRGQRVLNVNTSDLANRAQSFNDIEQRDLNTLAARYNTEMRRRAEAWAREHNQTLDNWRDPVQAITKSSRSITIQVRGLGRNGQNPYAPTLPLTSGGASVSLYDGHMTTVDLDNAPGSSNLGYRLGAEVARIAGQNVPASDVLLTNNRMRRQMQSVFADSIFGPGHVSPITSEGRASPQGVPTSVWNAADESERIGLNAMRAAHQVTENRGQYISNARFLENLQFNRNGEIFAATDPTTARGWPKGTVVTDQMLQTALLQRTDTGSAVGRNEMGGVGLDTAKFAIMTNTALSMIEGEPDSNYAAWLVAKAKQVGREMEGWMFSQSEQAVSAPITREAAEQRVSDMLGENTARLLIDGGILSFVSDAAELVGDTFSGASGRIQGATSPDGKITLVLGNLSDANFDAVLQHEGLHSTLQNLVGKETYDKLMGRLSTLLEAGKGSNWAKDAAARVPANTSDENYIEEVAAYAVEQYAKSSSEQNPLVRWAKEFMSAIRSAIIQSKLMPEAVRVWAISNITPADLQRLAVAGLRARATGAATDTKLSQERDYDTEIESLLAEHAMPETTNERRSEINTELGKVRAAQRVARDAEFEQGRNSEGASYGEPREGAVTVQGVHYSGAERTILNSSAYGTGAKGEEAARLNEPGNKDIKPRTMFYVDEGNGVRKEPGVGSVGHTVTLNNMYDIKADPLNIRRDNADTSAMERAVVAAGFDGYYAPNYRDMGQGVAVVIGEHSIPVDPYVAGGAVATRPVTTNTFAENLRKSKLPAGQMLGREWLVAIKGTEFDTAPVREALESRAGESIYRDDLIRFNDGLRLSVAEEAEEGLAPVANPDPRELNVVDNGARRAFERMVETLRTMFQDKHATLRRIQQLAGVTSERIKIDTIGGLERLGSRLMTRQNELVKAPLAQIENILNRAGFSGEEGMKALDDLLIAMHVKEYNAHIATINPARYEMVDGVRTHVSGFDAEHPGSGITDEQALETFRRLTGAKLEDGAAYTKATALFAARGVYRKMIADLQQYAVEQGLEKQAAIDMWNAKFPNYTPFNRDLDLAENITIGSAPGAQGFSLRTGISRAAMGSGAEIVSPIASTLLFGMKTTRRGENAEVSRMFLNFAREFTPKFESSLGVFKPMWKVEVIPNRRTILQMFVYQTKMADGTMSPEFYNRAQARDFADSQQAIWEAKHPDEDPNNSGIEVMQIGDGPQSRVVVRPAPNPMGLSNVMVIPEEGENVIITFDEQSRGAMAILEAFKGGGGKSSNLLVIPRMFSRWVMATATGYNPVFSVFNAARDITGAMVSVGSDKIPGWTRADSLNIIKSFPAAARSIWRQRGQEFRALHSNTLTVTPPAPGSLAAWADEMTRYGGATGVRDSVATVDDAETQIRRLFGQAEVRRIRHVSEADDWLSGMNDVVIKVGDAFARFGEGETKVKVMGWLSRNVVSATARLNEAAELATRTIVFKSATEKFEAAGYSPEEARTLAANISKNVSTNFNRGGSATNVMNQLWPFFNAAMQGSARLAETIFEKQTYTIDKNGVPVVDQRTKLTDFGKKVLGGFASLGAIQAGLLALAGFEDDEPPQHIRDKNFVIPLGAGDYALIPMPHGFNTIFNFGRETATALMNPAKAAGHLANALWQVPAFNPFGSAGNLATDFTPAIIDPFLNLYMNKDAFGLPIGKENPDPANPSPGFTRAKEGASKTGRVIAEGLNAISGGNEDQAGMISPTPDQVDFVFATVGGGAGREIGKAGALVKAGVATVTGEEREAVPTHRIPLIGRIYGSTSDPVSLRTKAFEVRKELNELNARHKGLAERGENEAAAELMAEHPELALRNEFERFVRGDSKERKARALARNSDEIGEVNRITMSQDEKIADLVERYKALRK